MAYTIENYHLTHSEARNDHATAALCLVEMVAILAYDGYLLGAQHLYEVFQITVFDNIPGK